MFCSDWALSSTWLPLPFSALMLSYCTGEKVYMCVYIHGVPIVLGRLRRDVVFIVEPSAQQGLQ